MPIEACFVVVVYGSVFRCCLSLFAVAVGKKIEELSLGAHHTVVVVAVVGSVPFDVEKQKA